LTFKRRKAGARSKRSSGKVLRDLGLDGEMYKRLSPPKQGVKVFGQSKSGTWFVLVTGRDQERRFWDTWHVRRRDFDEMMLDEAASRGAIVVRGKASWSTVSGMRRSDSQTAVSQI